MLWWAIGISAVIFIAFVLLLLKGASRQNERYDNGSLAE